MTTAELVLPWPPSENHLHAVVRGRKILSAAGRRYYEEVAIQVRGQSMRGVRVNFGDRRLSVWITLVPPDHRRRDIANYDKAILDSLTKAEVWDDDSQIDHLVLTRGPVDKKSPRVRVKISEAIELSGPVMVVG